jgi:hypothetical protein
MGMGVIDLECLLCFSLLQSCLLLHTYRYWSSEGLCRVNTMGDDDGSRSLGLHLTDWTVFCKLVLVVLGSLIRQFLPSSSPLTLHIVCRWRIWLACPSSTSPCMWGYMTGKSQPHVKGWSRGTAVCPAKNASFSSSPSSKRTRRRRYALSDLATWEGRLSCVCACCALCPPSCPWLLVLDHVGLTSQPQTSVA